MDTIKLLSVTVVDSTNISAKFSENLNQNISTPNVVLTSQTPSVPDPEIQIVAVTNNILNIIVQPLTPLAVYFITFQSSEFIPFESINGDAILFNDGVTNKQLIIGPIESDNPIKQSLTNFFRDNIFNTEDESVIGKYLQSLSLTLSKSLYDIGQVKNENYLSFTITDEQKTRSGGPFDRLNEEGAYEILRVGKNTTNAAVPLIFSFVNFPSDPVTLLKTPFSDVLTVDSTDMPEKFNVNTLTLNLSKRFVTKLTSVVFIFSNAMAPYIYDISKFGYQIQNSKYDTDVSFTYLLLSDNQIRLSEQILNDSKFSTQNIFQIQVSYEYKDQGRIVDPNSVTLDTVISSGREALPPIKNIFNLLHAPVVTKNNNIGSVGSVVFVDPNSLPSLNKPHPAFLYEILFRTDYLPARPGEYSVDYSTGTVYVFGADTNNDGTGAFPPLATYFYRFVFKLSIDYVYDSDTSDLVALPNGSVLNNNANIKFNFEQVLAKDIDYKVNVHNEILSERIGNNLVALNVIKAANGPITNVFRILNETSGEIYRVIRWNNDKIYFLYNNPPRINILNGERASFQDELNELLFVSQIIATASPSIKIYKMFLKNNNIISGSEDCIGSSINTSAFFSNSNIFSQEIYFDNVETESLNLLRLNAVGDYEIDYINGVLYCAVPTGQSFNIGTISYKRGYIVPVNPHIITVNDIYNRISLLSAKDKSFSYTNFVDGLILPNKFDISNERFLNNDSGFQYIIVGGQAGAIVDAVFVPGITNNIKFIRGLFELNDLQNNKKPLNFANVSVSNGKSITVSPLEYQEFQTVHYVNPLVPADGYLVSLNTDLFYISPNITISVQVTRISDSMPLWNGSGTIQVGSPLTLILPGINSPQSGDSVNVVYSFTINNLSNIVVDYNKGDYFIDYRYLADEIIISYEYGDNVLDFRQSDALSKGDTYFVTYKAGALRDALLKNFGTLINIPILNSLDVSFERERYREALMAALQSFIQGPTITAMKEIVSTIVHTPPEIIESAFQNWSLGHSLLTPEQLSTTGEFKILSAKYDNGVAIDSDGQTIKFPISSNLRIENGTFESWIVPEWDGIDNQSILNISILKNGKPLPANEIFIGPSAYHPTYRFPPQPPVVFPIIPIAPSPTVVVSKADKVLGTPNKSKDGVFIYYDKDPGGVFNRWYLDVLDGYADGYSTDGYSSKNYKIVINTNGKFYDSKSTVTDGYGIVSLSAPQPASSKIFTGTNSLTFTVNAATPSQGITFIADNQHYLFDFADKKDSNRFSIFKDESGYLNFRIIDKFKNSYSVNADISSWKSGQQHHVAAAWTLNSKSSRDEIHLFIDGFETPNIIKYGNKVRPYLHEKFRTINPEEIVGVITKNIIASVDLIASFGSTAVTSSVNFSAYGILPGDTIFIEEPGFSIVGYTILIVSGQTLTLAVPMPATINGGKFSVNKTSFSVVTEVDIYPNIAISLLHADGYATDGYGTDLLITSGLSVVTSASANFTSTSAPILPGYIIRIVDGYGQTLSGFESHYTILSATTHSLTLSDPMPLNVSNAMFHTYSNIDQEIPGVRALYPAYALSKDGYSNNIISIRDKALKDDVVLIKTLGVNHKRSKKRYYVWGDGYESVIMTHLPAPVSLDSVNITHILLPFTAIGPSNSTFSSGKFTSNPIPMDQPSVSDNGRSLTMTISGTNVDFSSQTDGYITGTISGPLTITEHLVFTEMGSLNTVNLFKTIADGYVVTKPINSLKNALTVEVKERLPITSPENSVVYPAIRFSYQVRSGNSLSGAGSNVVTDLNGFFTTEDTINYLVIYSPAPAAGTYQILSISDDHLSATISSILPVFTGGVYEILNVSTFRSGLQNGFFMFENALTPGQPYFLNKGLYEFDYFTYLSIPIQSKTLYGYVGTDFEGNNPINGIVDELQILSEMITDTRIGETVNINQESITKDFNSIKALKPNINTLMLSHFDTFPFSNNSDVYLTSSNKFIQSGNSINDNFSKSIAITDSPIVMNNDGILNTHTEGTIEFWVNPLFDTANDPKYRFYFDAAGIISEKVVSINKGSIKVAGTISQVLSVKLQVGDQKIDYFLGGSIDTDFQTIFLNKALPNEQTPVIVNYIPNGLNGDRISIYKDPSGYVNFNVRAAGIDYQVRSPAIWSRNTWHRLKASYKINNGTGLDEIRFFVDGYERGNVLFGNGLLFGQHQVFGSSFLGSGGIISSIKFKDSINEFSIGSDYTGTFAAAALIDNLRISNISRPLYQPFGESLDVNYGTNLGVLFPVTEDLYTTLLLDFDTLVTKNTDFVTLKNKKTGLFDFSINIFDSFGIVNSSAKVKDVLETLIKVLKPANSRVFINYK